MPESNAPSRPRLRNLAWAVLGLALLASVVLLTRRGAGPAASGGEFARLMNTGKNYLDQGQATNAIPVFTQAVALQPAQPDARVNLANALLLADQAPEALRQALEALEYDRNDAGAYYVAGCAALRLRQFEPALKLLQSAHDLDTKVAAVAFQVGRAHQELGHIEEAIASYRETIKLEPEHGVAHYALSQMLIRAGQQDEGLKEIEVHNQIKSKGPQAPATPATYERCGHTQARAPKTIERPDPKGIDVHFADLTAAAFGGTAGQYHGPLGVLDYNHDDRNSLFVVEGTNGFRLLANSKGVFSPLGDVLPVPPGSRFFGCLVGDLNNDRFEDVVVMGQPGVKAYRFATNGVPREVTAPANLRNVAASEGGLVDLDLTGKLDLLAVAPDGGALRVLRNLGSPYFKDITSTSGVPAVVSGARQLAIDDWNNDDLMDVIVAREGEPPLLLLKQRGGPLVPTNFPPGQLEGAVLAVGDLNNDSRADLVLGGTNHLDVLLGGINRFFRLPINCPGLSRLLLVDYDNDGWLDILVCGQGLQLWRNAGEGTFVNLTQAVGLDRLVTGQVEAVVAADFDQDGDTDLVVSVAGQGLKLLRNEGGHRNAQIKLRLLGNRSNASGLGIRVDVAVGGLRIHRTVSALPVEIGVGNRPQVDSLTARWSELAATIVDVKPDPRSALAVFEPFIPPGSCPFLYAWDGQRWRFVSDILGSSPVGLRLTDTVFIDADPHELVWLGDETRFRPRDGDFVVQVTEELREVLYLDEAKLAVVDHPEGTEVHTTDKLRPSKPFPRGELLTLDQRRPLGAAMRLDGTDVTALLQENDGQLLSPPKLRVPQLRGLAEPHGVVLDFGPLPADRPLVLALTGWLRFGGGMANVAASHDPSLPFPFPQLEVETSANVWRPVDVVVGAPSGKTKTILVELAGKLPAGSHRLRLTTAFEIHWDRIALFERRTASDSTARWIAPDRSDLHWRGFSAFADLPSNLPLTPVYEKVSPTPPWAITPMGWCTRYGPVNELIAREDNGLAILNGGDELTLSFAASRLPPTPAGMVRDFFLYTVGWDKDSDFHVELGWKVEPLPWHGMDDQRYGLEARPAFASDALMARFNTRWVNQPAFKRASR